MLYFIVKSKNIIDLERDVQSLLDDNWELYGFPFRYDGYLCQCVVQYKDDGNENDELEH